jgi:antitoxin HicB
MTKIKHVGSSFDSFLEEKGVLEECKEEAAKRVRVWQLEKEMQKQHLTKG